MSPKVQNLLEWGVEFSSHVALVHVGRREFECASIAADGSFELVGCLIVKDVPVYVYDLEVFPALVDSLVGFDEVVGLPGFHAFSVNVVAVKFDGHHDIFVSPS